jgi:hypothetical protein
MTAVELMVIAVGAPAGYWLVSFLAGGKNTSGQPPAETDDARQQQEASQSAGQTGEPAIQAMAEWHEVLGVDPQASATDIRDAYKRMLTQYHPDKVASLGSELHELANRKSQEITQAYRAAMTARGEPE